MSFNSLGSWSCKKSSSEVDAVSLGGASGESCLCVSPLPAEGCSRLVWSDMKLRGRQTLLGGGRVLKTVLTFVSKAHSG